MIPSAAMLRIQAATCSCDYRPANCKKLFHFLEENICKDLSLTGVNVVPNDLHACHRMKRTDRVIAKFKCRKQKNSVMYKRKNLGNKSQELSNLKFSGRLFVSESMSHENQQLA